MKVENNYSEWISIAEMDLSSARHLFNTHHPIPLEIVCFHAQQASEKALKGFLIAQGVEFPKTHDLQDLGERCEKLNCNFAELRSPIVMLNRYSVIPRYPNELQITQQDASMSLDCADKIMVFVKQAIDGLSQRQ